MFDIQKLKTLREKTGVSLSLCKKALEESNNNLEQAEKLLQKWGAEVLSKKAGTKTAEGAIFSYVHHNKKVASLVELVCQTDFVAKNQDFQKLGQEIAMQIASTPTENVDQLLSQEYIRDPAKKISDLLNEAALKFGENIKITRFLRWQLGTVL
jgi:elongation factor Ts